MILLRTLLAMALAPPTGGSVELDGAHALAIREAARDPGGAPAGPAAVTRTLELVSTPTGTRLRARWRIVAGKPGWFAARLVSGDVLVRRVTIDGRPAAAAGETPTTHVLAWIDGSVTLELDAFVRGDPARAPIELGLLPAVRGTATITGAPQWRLEAADGGTAIRSGALTHSGAEQLRVTLVPPPVDEGDRPLAVGRIGVGLLIGDAEIRGRARAQWVLRRGELARVGFTVRGVGDDLKIEGPEVREVVRNGDRVEVSLQAPQRSTVALELSWTQTTPKGDATVIPAELVLDDVGRVEASLEIGRDGDVDVVPELPGWRAIAAQQLPSWGRDLIEGSPSAVFSRHGPADAGRLQLLHFVPVEAPPVVIQQARFIVVAAEQGESLMQVRYEVINERASHLRVTLPAHARLLAVEVGGEELRPGRDGDAVAIPIKRSLETVEGLISTPVVVTLLLEERRWRRRDRRELPLVAVDAPIRKTTATVILPRDRVATIEEGEAGVVGVDHVYLHALAPRKRALGHEKKTSKPSGSKDMPAGAATSAADGMREAQADRLLEEAADLYNKNEFDEAQHRLDELRDSGGASEDARRLQSNLDIVNAPSPDMPAPASGVDAAEAPPPPAPTTTVAAGKLGVFRRVKEQARARAGKQVVEQRARKKRAEQLRAQGDYKAAEQEYKQAIEVNDKLKKLEQDEDATLDFEDEELAGELEATKTEAAAKDYVEGAANQKLLDPALFDPDGEHGFGAADAWTPPPASISIGRSGRTPLAALVPPRPIGPRVLMPSHGGDVVVYSFDLWAPGSRHALSIRARKRVRLPPR
jgi:hypothetical protein